MSHLWRSLGNEVYLCCLPVSVRLYLPLLSSLVLVVVSYSEWPLGEGAALYAEHVVFARRRRETRHLGCTSFQKRGMGVRLPSPPKY